jgi:hypothetical protein
MPQKFFRWARMFQQTDFSLPVLPHTIGPTSTAGRKLLHRTIGSQLTYNHRNQAKQFMASTVFLPLLFGIRCTYKCTTSQKGHRLLGKRVVKTMQISRNWCTPIDVNARRSTVLPIARYVLYAQYKISDEYVLNRSDQAGIHLCT